MGKSFPGPETGLWRIVLRLVALFAAVFTIIVSTAGTAYPVESFWFYLLMGLCGLWSVINLVFLCCKRVPHPGCNIAFDLIAAIFAAFLVAVSAIDATIFGGVQGRAIACTVFSVITLVTHFTMFVLACIDVHRRRRLPNPKAPYRVVSLEEV
ncbi:hypothetical protein N7466_009609 [Penicillium verhagenii]|uniref:uncharacterized protein n=1 Tax=Penicillium verhagenii TaxID=1562060 RepID=UPI002545968F|nr:uncharacterized protein N7466_009609 [Penicillium verhagenii]KAJ5921283.1 hypothetical protein N7466_009609 [Penicillium verhagenii]